MIRANYCAVEATKPARVIAVASSLPRARRFCDMAGDKSHIVMLPVDQGEPIRSGDVLDASYVEAYGRLICRQKNGRWPTDTAARK
jgi:hypothetical protein